MATTMKLIAKVSVGSGGAANMEFTSIPGTYTDLMLLVSAREETATSAVFRMRFNGDTGANYSSRRLQFNGSSVTSASTSSDTYVNYVLNNISNSTSSTFGNAEIYIPNYAGSTNKSVSVTSVAENNGTTAYIGALASIWNSTAAITSVTMFCTSGDFAQHSTAYLYGIKRSA